MTDKPKTTQEVCACGHEEKFHKGSIKGNQCFGGDLGICGCSRVFPVSQEPKVCPRCVAAGVDLGGIAHSHGEPEAPPTLPQTPSGKVGQPHDDWNGKFYETPTTSEHRYWNAGYEKGLAASQAEISRYREALDSAKRSLDCVIKNDKTVYNYTGHGAKNKDGLTLPPEDEGRRWKTPAEIAETEIRLIDQALREGKGVKG